MAETHYQTAEYDDLGFAALYRCRALADPVDAPIPFRTGGVASEGTGRMAADGSGLDPAVVEELFNELERGFIASFGPSATVTFVDEVMQVRVEPAAGAAWVGEFTGSDWTSYLTGLYATPHPDRLLVAAGGDGYLIPVRSPQSWQRLALAPVLGARRVPGHPILICWSFQDLAAYGPDGLLWHLEDLCIDDLRITEVRPDVIHGTNQKPPQGPDPYVPEEHIPFTVDPLTGRVEGGWHGWHPKLHVGSSPESRWAPPAA